jgi:hypothetical protein
MAGVILVNAIKMKSLVTLYKVTWVSDASGAVNTSVFTAKMGTIIAVEFIPGISVTQPDDLYDVDCLDAEGVSIFDNGAGATIGGNLSNVVATHAVPLVGLTGVTIYRRWHHGGTLQPTVVNAGDTNSGVINIYMVDGIL